MKFMLQGIESSEKRIGRTVLQDTINEQHVWPSVALTQGSILFYHGVLFILLFLFNGPSVKNVAGQHSSIAIEFSLHSDASTLFSAPCQSYQQSYYRFSCERKGKPRRQWKDKIKHTLSMIRYGNKTLNVLFPRCSLNMQAKLRNMNMTHHMHLQF